jgi:hypothetical protein
MEKLHGKIVVGKKLLYEVSQPTTNDKFEQLLRYGLLIGRVAATNGMVTRATINRLLQPSVGIRRPI